MPFTIAKVELFITSYNTVYAVPLRSTQIWIRLSSAKHRILRNVMCN